MRTADQPKRYRLPPLTPLSLVIEIVFIVIIAMNTVRAYTNTDTAIQLTGYESEWLTSSAQLTSTSMRHEGYIPLWQPWLEFGEPLIDNPFSFVLNPISTWPSLLYGTINGLKISVVWNALLAALGGWLLGRVLGFGALARVLLGLLCVGKGNMHAMIGAGYFQLGVSQAYFPWVFAGFVGVLRFKRGRWPIVLTVVAFTLMFWAGNIWYTLPTLIGMALLTVTHVIIVQTRKVGKKIVRSYHFDSEVMRRVAFAAVLTVLLSMITFLPIWANRDRIGEHANDIAAGLPKDPVRVVEQYVNGDIELYYKGIAPGEPQFYYSFVTPLWFLGLLFVFFPPFQPYLYRPGQPNWWQVWSVGLIMIVVCTIWGAGNNPIFVWLYNNVPLIGQWRFVGRALAVSSFWIAVVVAMRTDGLWRAVVLSPTWRDWIWPKRPVVGNALRVVVGALLAFASLTAASQVNEQWSRFAYPGEPALNRYDNICVQWLRDTYPNKELAVWSQGYNAISVYIRNRVRVANIAADFRMMPDPGTVFTGDMTRTLPEFGVAWEKDTRSFFAENGYTMLEDSPNPVDDFHCMYRKADALSYAFSVPLVTLPKFTDSIPTDATTPISSVERHFDRIAVLANGSPTDSTVITLQELAYPGWGVQVDGSPARLESVGGLIGVVLPPGDQQHYIYFQFVPPLLYVGGAFTLLAWLFCILYLLRAERFVPESTRARVTGTVNLVFAWVVVPAYQRVRDFLLDPNAFDAEAREEQAQIPTTKALPAPRQPEPVETPSSAPTDANGKDANGKDANGSAPTRDSSESERERSV